MDSMNMEADMNTEELTMGKTMKEEKIPATLTNYPGGRSFHSSTYRLGARLVGYVGWFQ